MPIIAISFDDMLSIAKEGSGFLTYDYREYDEFKEKTSYIKGLQNWGWIIGKGFYTDNINETIRNHTNLLNREFHAKVINIISIAIILTIILLIFSIYISKLLEKKFSNYKKEINTYIDKNNKQQHILSQQSKMAAMGEMLGNIAHQWRQPLSVITTVATGMKLQKEFDSLDDETFEKSIDNITNSALYLSDTIEDFRNFFRTDKTEIHFSIADAFEKVFKLTNAQFKNYEINFVKDINDFEIFGFENEFIQALINILNNSKDALENKEYKKLIFISCICTNIFCADIKKIGEDIYKIKDFTDVTNNLSPNEAKRILLENMRSELLKQVNGVDINSANIMERNSDGKAKFDIFNEESVNGVILEEKIISEKKDFKNDNFIINMEVQMKVGKPKGEEDSTYRLNVGGIKTIYNQGDKLSMNIEVSKDSYIYIFIKDEDNKVYQYYPNKYQKDNLLKGKNILNFPKKELFDIELSSNNSKDTLENIIVLATKEPINLLEFNYDKNCGLETSKYQNFITQVIGIDKSLIVKHSEVYKVIGER